MSLCFRSIYPNDTTHNTHSDDYNNKIISLAYILNYC